MFLKKNYYQFFKKENKWLPKLTSTMLLVTNNSFGSNLTITLYRNLVVSAFGGENNDG